MTRIRTHITSMLTSRESPIDGARTSSLWGSMFAIKVLFRLRTTKFINIIKTRVSLADSCR